MVLSGGTLAVQKRGTGSVRGTQMRMVHICANGVQALVLSAVWWYKGAAADDSLGRYARVAVWY
eukprot:2024911-Rhodomonas_salina.1